MPLLDHFHPPLSLERGWPSMHSAWANAIMGILNEGLLPARFFAETQIHIGSQIEVDVGALEHDFSSSSSQPAPGNGPVATMTAEIWSPPIPALVMATVFPDDIEIQVFGALGGHSLAAAIELISPGNKDRPETRRAFAAKCSAYLQRGVGLVIIDVVTERLANLHDELMRLMDQPASFFFPGETLLYVVAYHPARRQAGDQIDCWPTPLALGQPLPVVPLALRGGPTVPLDLETTYMEARRRSRL